MTPNQNPYNIYLMFSIKKQSEKKESSYLYLQPEGDGIAKWEELNQKELDLKVGSQELKEGCRLFKIEKEVKVEFQTLIHLK